MLLGSGVPCWFVLELSSEACFLFNSSEVGTAGGFLRSALYQVLNCGFSAFVSFVVVFYVLFCKSILKPGSCTNKTLSGKVFVQFSPVNAGSCPAGLLSPCIDVAQIMQSLSFLFTALPFPLYYEQPIQPLLSPQACLVENG